MSGDKANKRNAHERALHPETAKAELERYARSRPEDFLANPMVPLLLLEDPSWEAPRVVLRSLALQNYPIRQASRLLPWQWRTGAGAGDGEGTYGTNHLPRSFNAGGLVGGACGCGFAYGNGRVDGSGDAERPTPVWTNSKLAEVMGVPEECLTAT